MAERVWWRIWRHTVFFVLGILGERGLLMGGEVGRCEEGRKEERSGEGGEREKGEKGEPDARSSGQSCKILLR